MNRTRLIAASMMAIGSSIGVLYGPSRTKGDGSSSKRRKLDARYSESWHGGQLQARNGDPCRPPPDLDTHSRNRWVQGWTARVEAGDQ